MQRVYTDDRTLDECMAVYNRDVVMVRRATTRWQPWRYDSYYLNVMAGPVRKWMFTWEEDHAWINRDYPQRMGLKRPFLSGGAVRSRPTKPQARANAQRRWPNCLPVHLPRLLNRAGNGFRLAHHRHVACRDLGGVRVDGLRHRAFKLRIDHPVVLAYHIPARLRVPRRE